MPTLAQATLAGLGTAALAWGLAAPAQAFTLNRTYGTWGNVQDGAFIRYQTAGEEAQVFWGSAASASGPSGLGFAGVGALEMGIGDVIQIGTLRHFNNPIWGGTAASAVALTLSLDFADLGVKDFEFTLTIDETPNTPGTCVYYSVVPCADRIDWTQSFASQSFQVAGGDYTLELLGVREALDGELINHFISQEGGTSEAFLFARLAAVPVAESRSPAPAPNSVPEPGLLLGLGAIALLGVTGRRQPSA